MFTIFSDSQAAIKPFDSSVINSNTVYDCHRCLNEMANLYDIYISWVLKHMDILGNYRAYALTRRETNIELSDEFFTLGIPFEPADL